jgi:hypothetical protein
MEQMYNIGDYIEYESEYYNGGSHYYERCLHRGCIIEKDKSNYCSVVKQYGAQIWVGVKPVRKISEEEFISKFSIYDEHLKKLMQNNLPSNLKKVIDEKCSNKINRRIRSMVNYSFIKKFNDKENISEEVWCIQWYILHVLRSYEPYKINDTLSYCYGAPKIVKDFMEKNISFMIDMQFQSQEEYKYMCYLIQEKFLNYKYELGLISSREYMSKIFPSIVKKLELNLTLKKPFVDRPVELLFNHKRKYRDNKYVFKTTLDNLLGTKFLIPNEYNKYRKNQRSKCSKTVIMDLTKKEFEQIQKFPEPNSTASRQNPEILNTLKQKYPHNSIKFNKNKDLILVECNMTYGSIICKIFTIYEKDGKTLLGNLEFNFDDNDFDLYFDVYDIKV